MLRGYRWQQCYIFPIQTRFRVVSLCEKNAAPLCNRAAKKPKIAIFSYVLFLLLLRVLFVRLVCLCVCLCILRRFGRLGLALFLFSSRLLFVFSVELLFGYIIDKHIYHHGIRIFTLVRHRSIIFKSLFASSSSSLYSFVVVFTFCRQFFVYFLYRDLSFLSYLHSHFLSLFSPYLSLS